jgi:hypothetical protein
MRSPFLHFSTTCRVSWFHTLTVRLNFFDKCRAERRASAKAVPGHVTLPPRGSKTSYPPQGFLMKSLSQSFRVDGNGKFPVIGTVTSEVSCWL